MAVDRNAPQKHAWRARIVPLAAEGASVRDAARRTGTSQPTVLRWRRRFREEGVAGLLRDRTRPPGTAPLPPVTVQRVLELTGREPPGGEATHWTGRMMAEAVGISLRSVQRIWAAHGLTPHRLRRLKLAHDPAFAAKLIDVVGLYLDPPAHAVVLSVDEESQIRALERTRPGLPVRSGRAATMTHDCIRHGTTTLFAALDVAEGRIIGRCMQRHRHQEFLRFLNTLEAAVPAGKVVHVILDNYRTHKHAEVRAWLGRHPRFVFHFTPTSCSWLNAVETFFSRLTRRRLRRGSFASIVELQAAIHRFVAETNGDPRPFVWTADPRGILDRVRRAHQLSASVH